MDETNDQREKNMYLRFQEGFDKVYADIPRVSRLEKLLFYIAGLAVTTGIAIITYYVTRP